MNGSKKKFSENLFIDNADKAAINALYNNDASKMILKFINDNCLEDIYDYIYRSSYVRLTENNSHTIYDYLRESCEMFSLDFIPEVYIEYSYEGTADLGGMDKPFIILNSEYINNMDEKMLFGVLASEIAEIKAGHAQVKFLIWAVETAGQFLPRIAAKAINTLLDECMKNMVYTNDRAFYLSTEDYGLTVRHMFENKISDETAERFRFASEKNGEYSVQLSDFFDHKNNNKGIHMIEHLLSEQTFIPSRIERLNKFVDGGAAL